MKETLAASPNGVAGGKYLMFSLGQVLYGVPILGVKEILRMPELTQVPRMPDYILGVTNLRGKIIPVMDLRVRFHLPEAEIGPRTCVIVVQLVTGSLLQLMGLVVDRLEEVFNINAGDIEASPHSNSVIKYLSKTRGGIQSLLDIETLMESDVVHNSF